MSARDLVATITRVMTYALVLSFMGRGRSMLLCLPFFYLVHDIYSSEFPSWEWTVGKLAM